MNRIASFPYIPVLQSQHLGPQNMTLEIGSLQKSLVKMRSNGGRRGPYTNVTGQRERAPM